MSLNQVYSCDQCGKEARSEWDDDIEEYPLPEGWCHLEYSQPGVDTQIGDLCERNCARMWLTEVIEGAQADA